MVKRTFDIVEEDIMSNSIKCALDFVSLPEHLECLIDQVNQILVFKEKPQQRTVT
jgi:hypothetical protein